jgi:NTE family protein
MTFVEDGHGEREKPALVLGGGGAFGVIQAAYIQVAFEMGFQPQVVVGTSVGALNGAWVAMNPERPDELLRVWLGLDRLKLVEISPMRLASKLIRRPISVATNDVARQLIRRHLARASFSDTKIELGVVATNLTRGEKRVFREGPLGKAILASTAIPGVFEPVEIEGDLYVDGCVTASVDLGTAVEMGATEIFAINLTPLPAASRPRTAVGVLKQSFAILTSASTQAVEECLGRVMPVRVVRPDLSGSSPWRLDDSAGAIAHNLRLAREALAGVFDKDGHVAPAGTCWQSAGPAHSAQDAQPVSLDRYFHRRAKRQAL